MDLSAWLRNLGLGQYEQAFRDNAIGPDVLLQLTTEDLKELGVIPVGHRRKLLDAIAALRVSASPASDDAREATILSASPVDPIGERRQVTGCLPISPATRSGGSGSMLKKSTPYSSNSSIAWTVFPTPWRTYRQAACCAR